MVSRFAAHVRGNAVAYLALFVALSGSAYAAVTLQNDSVLSKHIKDGAVKKADINPGAVDSSRVKNGSLKLLDTSPAFRAGRAPAGHNHDARYVKEGEPDSVGAGMIADTTRSVPVALASFNDCTTSPGREIDFSSGADRRPDFALNGYTLSAVRYDDVAPNEDTLGYICSGFTAPPDIAGTVGLRILASKDADAGVAERFTGSLGTEPVSAPIVGTGPNPTLLDPQLEFAPGEVVGIRLAVWASGFDIDDTVGIRAVDFLYTSKQ